MDAEMFFESAYSNFEKAYIFLLWFIYINNLICGDCFIYFILHLLQVCGMQRCLTGINKCTL
jgi:hypothetical protein